MTYRIVKRQDYFYPVTVAVLGDSGAILTYEFNAQFKRFDQAQIDAIKSEATVISMGDAALCRRVLIGWNGVQDESGADLPFNPDSLDRLLADHGVRYAIASAWYASLEKELRKN